MSSEKHKINPKRTKKASDVLDSFEYTQNGRASARFPRLSRWRLASPLPVTKIKARPEGCEADFSIQNGSRQKLPNALKRRGFPLKSHGPGRCEMDKDRIKGSAKQVKGSVKEAAGKVTGDTKQQMEGKAEKTAGKAQNTAGGVKDAVKGK
jgi:uncharacterized protein YjbJ (UPF0337 family)